MAITTSAMSDDARGPDDRVLFCPFCRECFEGESRCPEHELTLVEFADLPRQAHERAVDWTEPVLPWDLRFGRLEIVLGVVASLAGFFTLPLVEGTFDDQPIAWTALEVASSRAPNLWTVPFAAALFVVFLLRRRSPLEMRGARVAAVLLAVMSAVSLTYSLWNVRRGVAALHGAVALEWGAGTFVIGIACVLLLIGGIRFGALRDPGGEPHGAEPDDDGPRIDSSSGPAEQKPKRRRR